MGRTVVVRESYLDEVRKLEWLSKSIQLDRRISEESKEVIEPQIAAVRAALMQIQVEIEGATTHAEPASRSTG